MREIKIACCQYHIENLPNWETYTNKITSLVTHASKKGADLILLPEYAGAEAACGQYKTDRALFKALQSQVSAYIAFYQYLARQCHIYIQPGTIIEQIAAQQYVNRAYFFSPNGKYGFQDKLQLTEFEKNLKVLQHGKQQQVFNTTLGNIGIAICYDSEFPELIRTLTHAGASLILVPSYTPSLSGYHRVFISCRARAIENQCYVAMTGAINSVELSGAAEQTYGKAAIFSPADDGFSEDGIIAQGIMNKVMTIFAAISNEKIRHVRLKGQVHNFTDAKRCEPLSKQTVNQLEMRPNNFHAVAPHLLPDLEKIV